MKNKIDLTWTEEMSFDAHVNGHTITIDAEEKVGGRDLGPRPKNLTLVSLGGCTAMDVISILTKMRVKPDAFRVEVEGELTEEHPKYYHYIKIYYFFKGKDLPMDKIEKAITLSETRYCGVTAMLEKVAKMEHEIIIEE